jgi:flagellum-specific peptidoglycan hydrolase FlgJ
MAKNQLRIKFIEQHKNDVINATLGTGLFPSVKMAQMILESSDRNGVPGNGITARLAKNFFGIKANTGYTGKKMAFNTPKDGQPVNFFRVYETAKDSVADHSKFLKVNSRYAKAGVFKATTPEMQALSLQKAGYAEGANYAGMLMQIIKDYNLTALDEDSKKKSI